MIAPLTLALGVLVADCGPDLHVTSAEAGRAVGAPAPAAGVLLREPEAGRRWFAPLSRGERLVQLTVIGLGLVDWGQTIRFTQGAAYRAYEESNPLLGRHPSRATVNAYFPLALGVYTLGVWALPSPYRDVLLAGGLALEGDAVVSNAVEGIGPAAPWR